MCSFPGRNRIHRRSFDPDLDHTLFDARGCLPIEPSHVSLRLSSANGHMSRADTGTHRREPRPTRQVAAVPRIRILRPIRRDPDNPSVSDNGTCCGSTRHLLPALVKSSRRHSAPHPSITLMLKEEIAVRSFLYGSAISTAVRSVRMSRSAIRAIVVTSVIALAIPAVARATLSYQYWNGSVKEDTWKSQAAYGTINGGFGSSPCGTCTEVVKTVLLDGSTYASASAFASVTLSHPYVYAESKCKWYYGHIGQSGGMNCSYTF